MAGDEEEFQNEVTRLALSAAEPFGFALGGGRALIAHGIVRRSTEDVDLFTDSDLGVREAAEPVEARLADAGLSVELVPETDELGELVSDLDEGIVEFHVAGHGQLMRLTLARFDRSRPPVRTDLGPVLAVEDVVGGKMAALAARMEPRDYIDIAAALRLYDQRQLMELAWRVDPAVEPEEYAAAMRRLDRLPDDVFTGVYGLPADQVSALRAAFADWPRY